MEEKHLLIDQQKPYIHIYALIHSTCFIYPISILKLDAYLTRVVAVNINYVNSNGTRAEKNIIKKGRLIQ